MNLQEIVTKRTGKAISQCSNKELYFSLLEMTKGMAEEKVSNEGKRKLYYISAEFLIGKLLSNNLINLGIYEDVKNYWQTMARALQRSRRLSRNHLWEMVDLDALQHVSLTLSLHLV